eukprot:gene7761-15878_t
METFIGKLIHFLLVFKAIEVNCFQKLRNSNIYNKEKLNLHSKTLPESIVLNTKLEILKAIRKGSLVFGAGSLLLPKSSRATPSTITEKNDTCSDSVSFLEGPKGRLVLIIGTAHISEDSALLVRKAILKTKPDTVMIELDPKRVGKINGGKTLNDFGFDVREDAVLPPAITPNIDTQPKLGVAFQSLLLVARGWAQAAAGAALGKALSSFYKSIEKLGFTPGGEFAAAVETGRASGSRILLGDRDVDITLQHLSQALAETDLSSFDRLGTKLEALMQQDVGDVSNGMPTDKESLSVLVEGMKQRRYISAVMDVVRQDAPKVYQALIAERDVYMAESITKAKGNSVVAVVGMAHMEGIENKLQQEGYRLLPKHCI